MKNKDTRFYTYIYLNPLKRGNFEYQNIDVCFLYEPFYVGKGCDSRISSHISEARRIKKGTSTFDADANRHKIYTILKIWEHGLEPIIIKLRKDIENMAAIAFEVQLIKSIGRTDLKTGALVNHTNGGDDGVISPEGRRKISERMKGENNPFFGKTHSEEIIEFLKERIISKDTKEKMKASWDYEKHFTEETRKLISKAMKGRDVSSDTKEKLRIANLGRIHTEETKKKISERVRGNIHTKESKEKISQTCKDNYEKQRKELGIGKNAYSPDKRQTSKEKHVDITHFNYGMIKSDEAKQKMSDARKGKYSGDKHPGAKTYILISPQGKEYTVTGRLRNFCEEKKLTYSTVSTYIGKGVIPHPLPKKCFMTEKRMNTVGWEIKRF